MGVALAAKWEHRCHPWRLACPVYLRRTRAGPGAAVKPTAENSWGKGQADWPVAGSVVVTAETLHRLSWGLPGAKTVSPDEYEVPLWWPCASTQVWGTWSWRRTDGGQTTKAPPPPPTPQRGRSQNQGAGWGIAGRGGVRPGSTGQEQRAAEHPHRTATAPMPPGVQPCAWAAFLGRGLGPLPLRDPAIILATGRLGLGTWLASSGNCRVSGRVAPHHLPSPLVLGGPGGDRLSRDEGFGGPPSP